MLVLENVAKTYGSTVAARDVSFSVADGELLTLLGPSGSGKSTILGLIAGYITPTSGTITLNGRDLTRVRPSERGVGVVFQHYALFPHMTVGENIGYGLRRHRWPKDRIVQRVLEMATLVGLQGLEHRRPSQLSGGQQQRVALARALAFEPEVLLMDEPLGALDRKIREQMQSEIRRIHQELEPTVIYVTHDKEEAYTLSDRIGIMEQGQLVALATPGKLYREPSSAWVADFFGGRFLLDVDIMSLDKESSSARVDFEGTAVDIRTSGDVDEGMSLRLAVAPDSVRVGAQGTSDEILVRAVVEDIIYLGSQVDLHCRTENGGQEIVATIKSFLAEDLSIGKRVELSIDSAGACVVPDA